MSKNPLGFRGGLFGQNSTLFLQNMDVNTTPNAARGEATITIGGEKYTIRFGMNVMRDVTKLTGLGTGKVANLLHENFAEASTALVACAVKRLPGKQDFTQDDAGDLLDGLAADETEALGEALTEALTVGPLMAALLKKVAAKQSALLPSENGTNTSNSLSAS